MATPLSNTDPIPAALPTMASSAASSNMSSRRSSFAEPNVGVPISSNTVPSAVTVTASSSSTSLASQNQPLQQQQRKPQRVQITADPFMRSYPKPIGEINVAEALAREPVKWSLGYWAKNARDVPPPPAVTQERMDKMKQELRQAQGELSAHWPKR